MSIVQGLKANQMNVVLVIQRVQGKVPRQRADDKLPRTRQQCWAGNTHPLTGFSEKWRGSCVLEGNVLSKLFHHSYWHHESEARRLFREGWFRIQMQSCYLWGISFVPCFAASTLWSSIIFVLVCPSIIQRLIVFCALQKFADTNELNCLAICRLLVI